MPRGAPPSEERSSRRTGRSRLGVRAEPDGLRREDVASGAAAPTRRAHRGSTPQGGQGSRGVRVPRLRAWLRSPDGKAVAVLVLLPVLVFVVPAALGHPAITGDNLIQNFPLRVLTGRQLREGHLPLWNPYVWSGSPLLGGLNSGSFYPFTFFFAFLAPVGAFVVNLLGVYWAGGLGMYALTRQYGLRPLACFLGALTFAFAGTMSGQLVHLGVIQGMGWMPLLVLAELRLSWCVLGTRPVRDLSPGEAPGTRPSVDAERGGSPWPWVALLGFVVGLEALTGEPRAMAETEVVGSAVAIWLLVRPYARAGVARALRVKLFGYVVLASVWGVALAAAELAPGWTFIKASQRAVETYRFFGSGSLRPSWSLLLLVPDLFGGSGHLGSVHYFNSYNLPEVTGYVGLLAAGAALALLVRSFGRRRAARASDWGMWLALGGFGLLLSWGSFTPLGHVWQAIPLFGRTRLQSRNLEIVDLALAVVFAFWADRALAERRAHGEERGRRWWGAVAPKEWRTWLPAVPAAAAIVVCVLTLAAPGPVEEWLQATATGAALARRLWPWFLAESLIACGVIALVVGWRRLSPLVRGRALVAVVVADLALFLVATSPAAPVAATYDPTHAVASAVLGNNGRFAIVDTTAQYLDTLSAIGQPDLNAFTRIQSVQGYGSIVSERYGHATGSHTLDTLNVCALERGTFTTLRLSALVAYPADLVATARPVGRARPPTRPACAGAPAPGSAHRRAFYLGRPAALRSATLVSTESAAHGTPEVGVVTAAGRTRWPPETVRRTQNGWSVTFHRTETAAGIVVEGPAREISETSTVTRAGGGRLVLDGELQDALDTSAWRFVGTYDGIFGVFRVTTPVRPAVWIAGPAPGSSVRQLSAPDWGGTTDRVSASHPVTVVWSESYQPGWHATLTPAGGGQAGSARRGARTIELVVHRHGLIQDVTVPAGTWTLAFVYRAPHLTIGLIGSAVAVAGFVVFGATVVVRRRTRRRRGRRRDRVAREVLAAPGPLPGAADPSR